MNVRQALLISTSLLFLQGLLAQASGPIYSGTLERDTRRTGEICMLEIVAVAADPARGADCFTVEAALKPAELLAPGATSDRVTLRPRLAPAGGCAPQALGGGIAGYVLRAGVDATEYELIARATSDESRLTPIFFARKSTVEVPGSGRRRTVIEQRGCGLRAR
jgi:hypothetical protein